MLIEEFSIDGLRKFKREPADDFLRRENLLGKLLKEKLAQYSGENFNLVDCEEALLFDGFISIPSFTTRRYRLITAVHGLSYFWAMGVRPENFGRREVGSFCFGDGLLVPPGCIVMVQAITDLLVIRVRYPFDEVHEHMLNPTDKELGLFWPRNPQLVVDFEVAELPTLNKMFGRFDYYKEYIKKQRQAAKKKKKERT